MATGACGGGHHPEEAATTGPAPMTTIAVPYYLDEPLGAFEPPVAVERTVSATLPEGSAWERMAVLYEAVAEVVAASPAPLVVSGDCTTSLGTLAGTQRTGTDPGVVWIDAHGDFNTEETTESGYLGGLPLAKICGLGDLEIVRRLRLAPVATDRVLLVGARDLDPAEDALLVEKGVRRATVEGLDVADLPAGPLFLHLDVDVADPADLPGLRYPAPGGPTRADLAAAVAAVAASGRLVAVDVGLTWKPDRRETGRRAAYLQRVLAPLGI